MEVWWPSLPTGRVRGMLQGPQCQCGAWVAWVVAPAWVGWVSLLRAPLSCTRSTIPCSILTPARRASKLFCSLSGHLTHNCDGVWILMMWFLYQWHYFCTFATLSPWYESLTEWFSLLRGERLRLKMARGQQKIQSQQKAAEKAAKLKKAVRKEICNQNVTEKERAREPERGGQREREIKDREREREIESWREK